MIYRYTVPADDAWHALPLTGSVLHVACRTPGSVDLWALHTDGPAVVRSFRVVGTGHPLPEGSLHVGTSMIPGDRLVWHLLERR